MRFERGVRVEKGDGQRVQVVLMREGGVQRTLQRV